MILSTRQILETYDFLKQHVPRETAIQLIERHVSKNQMVIEQNGAGILGIAVCWQIDDPNDVAPKRLPELPPAPEESALGKYVYLPFILIEEKYRKKGILKRLLGRCVEHCPGARRIAFRRNAEEARNKKYGARHPSRVHIIEVKHGDQPE